MVLLFVLFLPVKRGRTLKWRCRFHIGRSYKWTVWRHTSCFPLLRWQNPPKKRLWSFPLRTDIRPSCLVTLPDFVKTFLEPNNFVSCPLMLTSWLDVVLARDEMVLFWVISLISKGWFVIDFTIVCFSMTTFVVPYFLFSPYFLIFTGDLLFAKLSNFSFCSGKKHTALTTLSAVCRLQSKVLSVYFWLAAFLQVRLHEWSSRFLVFVQIVATLENWKWNEKIVLNIKWGFLPVERWRDLKILIVWGAFIGVVILDYEHGWNIIVVWPKWDINAN